MLGLPGMLEKIRKALQKENFCGDAFPEKAGIIRYAAYIQEKYLVIVVVSSVFLPNGRDRRIDNLEELKKKLPLFFKLPTERK